MDGQRYNLSMLIGLLTIAATIMIGGSSAMSVYGKEKMVYETPFESSTVPACSNEEVAISGIAKFVIFKPS